MSRIRFKNINPNARMNIATSIDVHAFHINEWFR